MSESLFRSEVAQQDQQRLLGTISLAQPLSLHIWIIGLVLFSIAILIFVLGSNYQRKEQVRGFLVPDKGLIRVHADQAGVVAEVHVKEGQLVKRGDALFTIRNERSNQSGSDLSQDLQQKVEHRIAIIRAQLEDNERLQRQDLVANRQRQQALQNQADHLGDQLRLSTERLQSQQARLSDQKKLVQSGHLPKANYDIGKEAFLSEQIAVGHQQQQLLQLEQQLQQAKVEAKRIPLQRNLLEQNSLNNITELEQQLRELEAGFERVIRASHDGEVAALQVLEGETVTSLSSLMTLIPVGSRLVAELLLPSRSIGLVSVGDSARLRFDAFPYQQFGLVAAEVLHIDQVILVPGYGTNIQEPVYRVRAFLASQQIIVGGSRYRLRAGMQVQADLLQEQRKLIEWLLSPIKGLQS